MSKIAKCECSKDGLLITNWAGLRVTGDYRVCCPSCPASTAWYGAKAEAIAAWNRRALPSREDVEGVLRHHLSVDVWAEDGNAWIVGWDEAADAVLALMKGETK